MSEVLLPLLIFTFILLGLICNAMQMSLKMILPSSRLQHVHKAVTKASRIQIHPICQPAYEVHETNVARRPSTQFIALLDNARTPLAYIMSIRELIRHKSKQVYD